MDASSSISSALGGLTDLRGFDHARALKASGERGRSFSASLSDAIGRAGGSRPGAAQPARDAAEELVSITLVQPVLAQVRESSMAAEPFAPSDAERRFGSFLDAEIARRIVSKSGFPLVDAVARQMLERSGGARARAGTEGGQDGPDDRSHRRSIDTEG